MTTPLPPVDAPDEATEQLEAEPPKDVQVPEVQQPPEHGITTKNAFQHPEAHPIVLDMIVLNKYGPEWLTWEPETLELRIREDFKSNLSRLNETKLQACKALHLDDSFWERWEIFNWCVAALNGLYPNFRDLQVPDTLQCMVAVAAANDIRTDVKWSSEVTTFISVVVLHDGLYVAPSPLEFAQPVVQEGFGPVQEEVKKKWAAGEKSSSMPHVNTQLAYLQELKEDFDKKMLVLNNQLLLVPHV